MPRDSVPTGDATGVFSSRRGGKVNAEYFASRLDLRFSLGLCDAPLSCIPHPATIDLTSIRAGDSSASGDATTGDAESKDGDLVASTAGLSGCRSCSLKDCTTAITVALFPVLGMRLCFDGEVGDFSDCAGGTSRGKCTRRLAPSVGGLSERTDRPSCLTSRTIGGLGRLAVSATGTA